MERLCTEEISVKIYETWVVGRVEFKNFFVFFSNRKKKLPFVTKTLVLKFESN